jgi:hypothetical protein
MEQKPYVKHVDNQRACMLQLWQRGTKAEAAAWLDKIAGTAS